LNQQLLPKIQVTKTLSGQIAFLASSFYILTPMAFSKSPDIR
jgi:hypothetical protein